MSVDQSYELLREDELRKLFPNISKSTLRANTIVGSRLGPRSQLQELQAGDPGQQHGKDENTDRAEGKAVDGALHGQFRITVNFKVSDNRRRDLDGMLSTIFDCQIAATGRFAPVDTGDTRDLPERGQRTRRSGDPD